MIRSAEDAGGPTLELAEAARARIARALRRAAPAEACGLLLGRRGADGGAVAVAAGPCRNRAPDPRRHFVLDPGDWVRWDTFAARRGLAVVGVWHTHPGGDTRPSAADRSGAPEGLWSVVCALGDPGRRGVRDAGGPLLLWEPFRAPDPCTDRNGRERRTASSPSMGHTSREAQASEPPLPRHVPPAPAAQARSLPNETPR